MNPRIYLLALGNFAIGTGAFVIAGVLPSIAREVNVTIDTAGQLLTAFSFTYGVGAPFLLAFTSNFDPRRLLILALLFFSLANLLSALSPAFFPLLLTRVLAACCAALFSPTAYMMATSMVPPERRGSALSLVVGGLTASTVLGVPFGTWIGQNFGWHWTFGMVTALGGLALLVLLIFGLPQITPPPHIPLKARLAPITQPRILLALLPMVLWISGGYIVYTYITPILQRSTQTQDVSGLLLVYGLGGLFGNWLGGFLTDRLGIVRPMLTNLTIFIVMLALFPLLAGSVITVSIALFLWASASWSVFPPQQYRLLNLAPEHAGVILALNNSALYLGIAIGAALGGLLWNIVSLTVLAWAGSGFVLLALISLLWSIRTSAAASQNPELKVSSD